MPMPRPAQDEKEQDFVSRFMADTAMLSEYPDQKQRAAVAYSTWRERGADVNSNANDWPSKINFDFIEPGLVNYADKGTVLVRKSVLDKMANTMEGKPVVNDHQEVKPTDYKDGNADGMVASVFYNEKTGMHAGLGFVWDPAVKRMIKNGAKVSCSYKVTKWGPGGVHNNIPYEAEVLDGEYDHLAIVADPRYEDVSIKLHNSKGGKTMNIFKFWKKDKTEEIQLDADKAMVEVGTDKKVSIAELIQLHNSTEALNNAKLADEDMIDVGGGKKVALKDLKAGWSAKNAADDEAEKKKKEKEEEDRKNAAEKDAVEKLEKAHDAGDHKDKEVENCKMCNAAKDMKNRADRERLDNAARMRSGELRAPSITTPGDKAKSGAERYGSAKK